MTALPKRRTSTRRKGKRRRVKKIALLHLVTCPSCGHKKLSHRVCPNCGKNKVKK